MPTSATSAYFHTLNQGLRQHERAIPMLLIDLDILDHNIAQLQAQIQPSTDLRLVVKSLPSRSLLQYVMERTSCQKLMVFHQPFLNNLATYLDTSIDILLGKPMPVSTAHYFYNNHIPGATQFDPFHQVQWLVDTTERLLAYAQLASTLGQKLRVNLEIDVGLHRGGFITLDRFRNALQIINEHTNHLEFSGLMGYDPHVVKLPRWLKSPAQALHNTQEVYQKFIQLIQQEFPNLWRNDLVLNGAGSPTFSLHQAKHSLLNDIAVGSALVKPSNFDIPSLASFRAASWIATPVLKKQSGTRLPGLGKLPNWLSKVFPYLQESYFIYGGYWKADYHYPPDIRTNPLFGESTNQSMLNASGNYPLGVGDFIFLRPWQSEAVFLQFGRIMAIRAGNIVDEWSLLPG